MQNFPGTPLMELVRRRSAPPKSLFPPWHALCAHHGGPQAKIPGGPWNHCYATDYGNILRQVKKNLGGVKLAKK